MFRMQACGVAERDYEMVTGRGARWKRTSGMGYCKAHLVYVHILRRCQEVMYTRLEYWASANFVKSHMGKREKPSIDLAREFQLCILQLWLGHSHT